MSRAYHGLLVIVRRYGENGVMVTRRRVAAVWAAAALIFSTTLLAQQAPQQNTQQNRKLSDAQRREIQATTKIVDGAMAGQPMPNDLSLAWVREDLLKAQ